jgi:hypothetical protein
MARRVFVPFLVTVNDTPIGSRSGVSNQKKADVQLIQFLLSQFFAAHPKLFKQLAPSKSGRFLIDGDCGPQTKSGIWVYQTYESRRGTAIHPDGVVDPASASTTTGDARSATILALNDWYFQNGDPKFYARLQDHPDVKKFAPELRAELGGK